MQPRPMPFWMTAAPVVSASAVNASTAPSSHTSVPPMRTGWLAAASRRAMRATSSGSWSTVSGAVGSAMVLLLPGVNTTSMGMSTNVGPRWVDPATRRASATVGATSSGVMAVTACLVSGPMNAVWSISWRLPVPQVEAGARPPLTRIGEPPNRALATADTLLVTPGPAVRAATVGRRVSLARPSAAKVADCSWRKSHRATSACRQPSYSGKMCPPERVKRLSTPAALSACIASAPLAMGCSGWALSDTGSDMRSVLSAAGVTGVR